MTIEKKALTPEQLADKCEAWLQTDSAPSNIVDAYEAGYRQAESDLGADRCLTCGGVPSPACDHAGCKLASWSTK